MDGKVNISKASLRHKDLGCCKILEMFGVACTTLSKVLHRQKRREDSSTNSLKGAMQRMAWGEMDKQVITKKYLTHQFVLHMPSYVCCLLDERLLKSHLESPLVQLVSRFMETLDSSAKKSVNTDHKAHRKSFKLSGVVMILLKQEKYSPSFFQLHSGNYIF